MIKKHSSPTTKEVKAGAEMPPQPKLNWSMVAIVAALAGILLVVNTFRSKTDEFN